MSDNLEYCFKCDELTGCAGRADDSHYNEDGEGPFCWGCWCEDENTRLHEQIEQLQSRLTTATATATIKRLEDALEAIRVIPRKRKRHADLMKEMVERAEQALKSLSRKGSHA